MTITAVTARILRYLLIAASLWYLVVYVAVAWLRLRYPFDLEWMEGGSVDHVVRVLQHQPLYVAPQIAFIPFEYPPLYFWVSALVAKIVGIGFFPLRLVSFLSSLVCFACIYRIVRTETNRTLPGLLAAGLFAGTFRASGAWLDLARVDSLFLALFLLALLILRTRTSDRWYLTAGVLLALSFLTKQTALAMAFPIVLYALLAHRRAGIWLASSLIAIVGVSSLLLHLATNADFKLDAAEARRISPLFWNVERGRLLDAVVGGAESSEFLRHSKLIADTWRGKGVETRYESVPGMNHFTICDPMRDPDSAMTKRMVELAERT